MSTETFGVSSQYRVSDTPSDEPDVTTFPTFSAASVGFNGGGQSVDSSGGAAQAGNAIGGFLGGIVKGFTGASK